MSEVRVPEGSAAPLPQGRYVPAVVAGDLVYTAGMTPRRAGTLALTGCVGTDVTPAQASWAAGLAAGNALLAVSAAAGARRISRAVQMTVYVRCTDDFTALSAVADGASAVVARQLGDDALPARTAVGVRALPGGAPVEVALTVALA